MNSLDGVFSVAGAIVTVALVYTIVSNRNSAQIVTSITNGFADSIKAAQGRG